MKEDDYGIMAIPKHLNFTIVCFRPSRGSAALSRKVLSLQDWVSERVTHRQSVRLGRTMKLLCPVEGDPPPLIMWTKDGRNIHSGWTRFKVLQHGLRIKEVETEDAGTYICKATNGFGSVNINYTLIVIGFSQWSGCQQGD
ncbi:unnamed protein product [Menidia menidia]|uniref:(Atlantic silverside) hypothetical protein n=1 Tax=Menidia menidia TaxID=238744 RepID=A0A8S4BSV3_9TELE|nr:unnamed protein product [Menidia menidia]